VKIRTGRIREYTSETPFEPVCSFEALVTYHTSSMYYFENKIYLRQRVCTYSSYSKLVNEIVSNLVLRIDTERHYASILLTATLRQKEYYWLHMSP
jgi:hypothetical protein